jgi:fumarate reductase flavoprotein subunit
MLDGMELSLGRFGEENVREAFASGRDFFYKADDIDSLARLAGVDATGLAATVDSFNRGQAQGSDALGRRHMPLPLVRAPYYALKLHGWYLTTFSGLAVNGQLQVIREDGSAVGNLFAAGEILGTGNLSGKAYCGGMLVTPALTFGRLLGQKMLDFVA